MNERLISTRFPYLPVQLTVRGRTYDMEALLDTGFDGDVVIPQDMITTAEPPNGYLTWRLADGAGVRTAYYLGSIRMGGLGAFPVVANALAYQPTIGRGVTHRFTVILDNGRQVIVER